MANCVCVVVVGTDSEYHVLPRILMVTRKNDQTSWCFPGGKVEPGEDQITAVCRETREETGLNVFDLKRVYEAIDDHGNHCSAYLAMGYSQWKLEQQEEGVLVKWGTVSDLLSESSQFKKFNREVLSLLGLV